MNSSALVIMAKEPKVGSTKTRLCPPLKLNEAAKLYEALLWDTISMTAAIPDIDLAIAVTPPESTRYFQQIAPMETILIPVACSNIGECLSKVLIQLLNRGYERVFALNSDGPSLPPSHIQTAIKSLDKNDITLGPADDGGYYLIGLKEAHTEIFTDILWSTDQVLKQTLNKAKLLSLKVHLLPTWYDIDTANDIERLQKELKTLPPEKLIHTRQFIEQWPGKT